MMFRTARQLSRSRRMLAPVALTLLAFAGGCASSHPAKVVSSAGMVSWIGEMHRTIMEGKTAAQVHLADLPTTPGLNAVGPVEGLAGEITVIDGVAHVGEVREDRLTSSRRADAGAPFLVWANVREWAGQELPPDALTADSLEERLPTILHNAGFDLLLPKLPNP